jgi:quinolinate synthase
MAKRILVSIHISSPVSCFCQEFRAAHCIATEAEMVTKRDEVLRPSGRIGCMRLDHLSYSAMKCSTSRHDHVLVDYVSKQAVAKAESTSVGGIPTSRQLFQEFCI